MSVAECCKGCFGKKCTENCEHYYEAYPIAVWTNLISLRV